MSANEVIRETLVLLLGESIIKDDVLKLFDMSQEYKFDVTQLTAIFPLYTKADLVKRWGIKNPRLDNWEKRHDDFPERMKGIMASEKTAVYPHSAVLRYENARGGLDKVAEYNANNKREY